MERNLEFSSYDGTSLEGTYASGDPDCKAVAVMVHGITSSRDEFGLFSGLASYLSKQGIPSFRFDYRCHGKSKRPIEELTLAGIVHDIEAAAAIALAQASATALHIVGMSFGGGLCAFWAGTTQTRVLSATLLAPVIDYEEDVLGQHGALVDGRLIEKAASSLRRKGHLKMDGVRYGSALVNELRFISGIEGLRRLECPAVIIHGDADSVVPYSSSERAAREHERCELVNIPGTDHGFGVPDDEDLSSPETKAKHQEVFAIIGRAFESASPR